MTKLNLYPDEAKFLVDVIDEELRRQDQIKLETGYPCAWMPREFQRAAARIFADRNGLDALEALPRGLFELIGVPRNSRNDLRGVLVFHPFNEKQS
jgi:hypothetical protein